MSIRPPELDRATVAFRRLLARANEDEQARVDALLVLGQRLLLAPTWSPQDAGIRTLTNAAGETAMPLFTAGDALDDAARRFHWHGPDGQLSFRELPAREAVRQALARGVHFVVLDIGSAHSTEFMREELAPLLTVQQASDALTTDERTTGRIGEAVRKSTRPPRRANESFPPPPPPPSRAAQPTTGSGLALGLDAPFAELDSPFQRAPARHDARPSVPRDRRTEDRIPVVVREERPFAAPAREERPFAAPEKQQPLRREPTTGVARRVDAFPRDDMTREQPSVPPRTPDDALPPLELEQPAPRAKRSTLASRIDAVLPDLSESANDSLPALDALDAPPAFAAPAAAPAPPGLSGAGFVPGEGMAAFDMAEPESEGLEARPAALEAAALVTELARTARDADAREAAAELAELLKMSAAGEKLPGEEKPKADPAAEMAALLMGGAQPAAKSAAAARGASSASTAAQPAAQPGRTSASTATQSAAKPTSTAMKAAPGGLRRPEVPLSDELIDQLGEVLRGYPEVEWACEASDEGELPVVGLRVDPSFLSRVAEITAAITGAGMQRGTRLSVALLTDPEKMKRARNLQTVFFPGKRRLKR